MAEGGEGLAAAVSPREGHPPQQILHLPETEVAHGDGRGALPLEASLAVEGHEELLANEQRSEQTRKAAQVLQVAPQQDGALALLPERAVHRQHMDVDRGALGTVEGQGVLGSEVRVR